jgi:hypothetical protein
MKTKLFALALAAAFTLPALAQTATPATPATPAVPATPKLDQREANQQKRIDQGVKSGALNDKEAARMQKRQDRLAKHEAKAKADGVVTPQERRRLNREANHNSRAIHRQKHDGQHK